MSLNRLHDDTCNKQYQEALYMGHSDYVMNRQAWMRGTHCYPGGAGNVCSSYGPFDNTTYGRQVTRDSFLSGRGQTLSNCPECQVVYLPDALFEPLPQPPNEHDALPTELTRGTKACGSTADMDMTAYFMMPRGYQDDWRGTLVQTFGEDTKTTGRLADLPSGTLDRNAQQGVTSYGFYPTCR